MVVTSFDYFGNYEYPSMILCNPGSRLNNNNVPTKAIGLIHDPSDLEISLSFNQVSEINFRVYIQEQKYRTYGNYKDRIEEVILFNSIEKKRMIYVNGFGYYIVSNVNNGIVGEETYKDVTATSCESELSFRGIPYIGDNSTLPFYNITDDDDNVVEEGLFNKIMSVIPTWSEGYISDSIKDVYRTFETIQTNQDVLSFMINDMQLAYGCIFKFDNTNRVVNVYSYDEAVIETDIYLSNETIIESMNISNNSDEIYTALRVVGGNDLSIRSVNPTGSDVLYDFSHFYSWMNDTLANKVRTWSNGINGIREAYYTMNGYLFDNYEQLNTLRSEIDRLNIIKTMYQRCRDNVVAEYGTATVGSYNAVIVDNGGQAVITTGTIDEIVSRIDALISDTNSDISDVEDEMSDVESDVEYYKGLVDIVTDTYSFKNYFTAEEQIELSNYIFEGEYKYEYIITSDSMTESEKLQQMNELMDKGLYHLSLVSSPRYEYEISTEDFIFQEKFSKWAEQIDVGCSINVVTPAEPDSVNASTQEHDVSKLFLSNITMNFEDKKVDLKFGNKIDRYDIRSLFEDVFGNITKSANSVSMINSTIQPIRNGELTDMRREIDRAKIATTKDTIDASTGEVLIDTSGVTNKRETSSGVYSPIQVKVLGESIVVTDDSWNTTVINIGKIRKPNGNDSIGINISGDFVLNGRVINDVITQGNVDLTMLNGKVYITVDGNTVGDGITIS